MIDLAHFVSDGDLVPAKRRIARIAACRFSMVLRKVAIARSADPSNAGSF